MNKALCFFLLVICCISTFAQSLVDIKLKVKYPSFRNDTFNFKIIEVVDQRENKETLGSLYLGPFRAECPVTLKRGLPIEFYKYFSKAQKQSTVGKREVVVAFNEVVYNENKANIRRRGKGKEITLGISLDYYEVNDDKLTFLFNDKEEKVDFLKIDPPPVNRFLIKFFKSSFKKLNSYLENNPPIESSKQLDNKIILEEKDTSKINDEEKELIEQIPQKERRLTSMTQIPTDVEVTRTQSVATIERFKGNSANGYRFRYQVFRRKWDDFNWVPSLSMEGEGLTLNNQPQNLNVSYGYFAFGIGALKPLNNYFYLDLGMKVGFGQESIEKSIFIESEINSLFGFFVTQRINFMVGKGFGLVLTVGTYQNFFTGTEYLTRDIGFIFGSGLKF